MQSCVHTNSRVSLFKGSHALGTHIQRRRGVTCSITGGGVMSLSLSLSSFPCLGAGADTCAACVGATHPPICAHWGPRAQSPSGIFLRVCRVVTYDGHHRLPQRAGTCVQRKQRSTVKCSVTSSST